MCGIGGIVNLQRNAVDLVSGARILSQKLRHRGPDDEGHLFFGNGAPLPAFDSDTQKASVAAPLSFCPQLSIVEAATDQRAVFVHRRLAIIDTGAGGHQPMCDASGRVWVAYNGEIYNFPELRAELEALGFTFRTASDTEVLLNSYLQWGEDCLQKFNGMFAFALWDEANKKIFCARDRSGVKPFYYYFRDGVFCFASELKALNALPFVETGLNEKAVNQYLMYNLIEHEPEGFLKNIFELPPAHYLLLPTENKNITLQRYYAVDVNEQYVAFEKNAFDRQCAEIRGLATDAILKRLRSDVAVGCCLSGGVDSSIIAGVTGQHNPRFKAFTAAFPGEAIDESNYAEEAARFSGAEWHKVTPTAEELAADYEQLVYALDIPIWSTSTYAQFRVMRLAQENGIKVVLDGQGGDELFAGYPHYLSSYLGELLRSFHIADALRDGGSEGMMRYLRERTKHLLHFNRNTQYLESSFVNAYSDPRAELPRSLNRHLHHDFFGGLLKTYLRCEDRCSMHHSVESRTPFADDTALIAKAFSLPASVKIHRAQAKFILRESMKQFLPVAVYERRDKMGFVTPHNRWLPQLLQGYRSLASDPVLKPYFNRRFWKHYDQLSASGNHLPNGHARREETLAFQALTFSVWYRAFRK